MKIVGIDLAGSERRRTGFCIMNGKLRVKVFTLFEDKEIVERCAKLKPDIIAVDAPLSLPKGRKSLKRKSKIHFRKCDRELYKLGIKFFPITLGPMRKLTERGMRLKKKLERMGLKVIEVYPGGAQDIFRIPRKKDKMGLLKGLKKLGVKGLREDMNEDELDAVTCALVGFLYLKRKFLAVGDPREGLIILPSPQGGL